VSPEGGKTVPSESKKVKAVPSESEKVKAVPSESKKVKPISIKRPKTPTGTTLVQAVPVAAKKSTSPKPDSASPDTESSKALITSVSDQKTPPTKDRESSKEIVSELPASPLPSEMSAKPGMDAVIKPGMDAVIKPATSSIIKPSTFTSKPVPSSQPMEAHAIALAFNPSGDDGGATVKPAPASKTTRARHGTSDLPNPFSKVHASRVTTLKGTPSSAKVQKTPKSPPRERRRSGSSHTLSSAQQKHSSTHDKHTPQKRTPVTQPKHSPPHPMSDEEVAKRNTDPVKQAETAHSGNMAEHEHVPGSTGGTDVLNSSDQKWTQPSAVPYISHPKPRKEDKKLSATAQEQLCKTEHLKDHSAAVQPKDSLHSARKQTEPVDPSSFQKKKPCRPDDVEHLGDVLGATSLSSSASDKPDTSSDQSGAKRDKNKGRHSTPHSEKTVVRCFGMGAGRFRT